MDDGMERSRIHQEMTEELRYLHRKLGLMIRCLDNDKASDSEAWIRMAVKHLISSTECLKEDLHLLNYLRFRLNTAEREGE